ncbi:TonB-dependent siderophore receptor [Pseudomonas sp. WS 5059]|jgi:ferric enterobactin receptor|uniref:TonB-dependent siderophore receptor n=1 Tax=unclassified Pseudomonas TaxID=196821 RepID=UPI001474E9E6|nr:MULTISPECIES: TonB-dependent siderophore receptor [unclassified Pseudomonas]NMX65331.1 TonB-dependent siderophore receptor [Pseudomonas sp. WS 5079]NMX70367.1 TonB-dependent siderophore receptor [Pseudomonas sp. WS 5111]NMX84459.1 TonB-dependent siderophore receptor [Pseudomonas sp. WS 5010]NMY06188.1 TonB-dependent siderophore receptor [Pseudomonas sp. WS 5059]NMY27542.1 TonB-dependent siderophore receptor [Pseudomonas sp. WS 5021]
MHRLPPLSLLALSICSLLPASGFAAEPETPARLELQTQTVLGTAQEEIKQAPGVSIITAEDIKKRPPANDLSDIIRTMPGVNLTGNSSSGQRGNNRQIDIRGMGPENTLILIDGKPVGSRNSVRYGWRGERDSRGDSNWVPADQVERIEVIRGPAAARYGNGAAGGVVNIITQQPGTETHGSATIYHNFAQHSAEGETERMNFGLNGPLTDTLSYRVYGNVAKTNADDADINSGHESRRTGNQIGTLPAGREGVRNKDINGLLSWKITPEQTLDLEAGFSRQGNIYTGDTQNTNSNANVKKLLGHETNVLYRETYAVTHRGDWELGTSLAYLQYEKTRNSRISEGLAGGTEGIFSSSNFNTTVLRDLTAHGEVSLPLHAGVDQVLTVGTEWVEQQLDDPSSNGQTTTAGGNVAGLAGTNRSSSSSARIFSVFVEDNIELRPGTRLTPGLRLDHHDIVGDNWSPSLNLSQVLTDTLTLKAGIARSYKAPNLYQLNPNYLLYSNGQGCYGQTTSCYLQGNAELDAETSVNKELGIEYRNDGVVAGLTYFRNDYKNKIESGLTPVGNASGGTGSTANASIFRWENVPKALVEGLEGTLALPLTEQLNWTNNFTYMLQSKNKQTGDVLSVAPKYTLNSMLDWQATDDLSLQMSVAWYGKQTPKKYDYHGNRVTGSGNNQLSPYAIAGVSGTYALSKNLSLTAGVDNLFDKRLWREGNAQGVANIEGAGAATYNQSGRTLYTSLTASF